jgi:hypothetical protein
MTETIKVEVRNQKSVAQKVRVLERPYRWTNWQLTQQSDDFTKLDSATIAFDVEIPAEGTKIITYTATYAW